MENTKTKKLEEVGADFFDRLWEESWVYIKTVVDVVREPVLILNKNLCVLAANESFYDTFRVEPKDTEDTLVYKLGNGQWDIPSLKKLLEEILPKHTFFKGFKVAHDFPSIGRKVMILNARQIHFKEGVALNRTPSIIMLAIEDVTEIMDAAEMLAYHTNQFEVKIAERTGKLEVHIATLEKTLNEFKKKASK